MCQFDESRLPNIGRIGSLGVIDRFLSQSNRYLCRDCRGLFKTAKVVEPLTHLTKKNAKWEWTEDQQNACYELKRLLTSTPILRPADETKPYIIKSDASAYAIGAVLVQG